MIVKLNCHSFCLHSLFISGLKIIWERKCTNCTNSDQSEFTITGSDLIHYNRLLPSPWIERWKLITVMRDGYKNCLGLLIRGWTHFLVWNDFSSCERNAGHMLLYPNERLCIIDWMNIGRYPTEAFSPCSCPQGYGLSSMHHIQQIHTL